ncbi:MAG: hypothetical protein OEV66_08520 [Spirochaetia bacterium]|nr:hypothetical protein [Spirochaetia bacterium]
MYPGKIKTYLHNISIKKDLPKLIFITVYVIFIILTAGLTSYIEYYHKKNYQEYFNDKMNVMEATPESRYSSYEYYYDWFQKEIPQDAYSQNIVFILWDKDSRVLWHSNKLVEKFVGSDASKSNELFKNMKFLDIPEKKFKPYELYEKYKPMVSNRGKEPNLFITEFRRQMVFHFFKIPDIKQDIYVEVLRSFHRVVNLEIFIFMLLISLLVSLLFTFLAYFFIRMFLAPIEIMELSMDHFIKYRHAEIANYYSANEPGQLVKKYNILIQKLGNTQSDMFDDADGGNQKTVAYLQQRLLRKAIRKSNHVELLLYPKKPDNDFREFVTLEEEGDLTSLLYVHFDINNIESNIEKHILQDKFRELNEKSLSAEEINEELYKDFISHTEMGPGFLFLRILGSQLEWVKSGPFALFLINFEDQSSELLNSGEDFISSEKNSVESLSIGKKSVLIISNEIFDFLDIDSSEFSDLISKTMETEARPGKSFLGWIIDSINHLNPEAIKQSSLLSLVRIK